MGIVYSSAATVLVWLGERSDTVERAVLQPEGDSSDRSLEIHNALWKDERYEEGSSDIVMTMANDISSKKGHYANRLSTRLSESRGGWRAAVWRALAALCDRAYWQRSWVVREISLARQRVTIHCGSEQTPLSLLEQLCQNMLRSRVRLSESEFKVATLMVPHKYGESGTYAQDIKVKEMRTALLDAMKSMPTSSRSQAANC
jgi:hypothetical protein